MRRCQVFNIFAGVSVPSFAVKPGMLFLRWFVRKGSIAWVPWSISFTFVACSVHGESATFLTPAAGERHGGRFARPHAPRHCAENGRCAVCSTPASSGGPGRTPTPVSTCPLAALFVPSMGFPLRGHANVVQKRSWCFYPEDRSWMHTGVLVPWPSRCDILAKGFSAAEWSAWNKQKKCGSPFSDPH